jgi:hypothetical protein
VDKFPSSSDAPLDATAAVNVHKLNRIYIFGVLKDESGTFVYFDDIWYIDLLPNQRSPPLPPPLLNCSNLPSGISYPHPTDQASFIICRNATDYEVFTRPRICSLTSNSVLPTQLNSSSPVSPASRSRGLTPILVIPRSLSSANNVGPRLWCL